MYKTSGLVYTYLTKRINTSLHFIKRCTLTHMLVSHEVYTDTLLYMHTYTHIYIHLPLSNEPLENTSRFLFHHTRIGLGS